MAISFSSYSHTPFSSIRHISLPLTPYSQPLNLIPGFSRRSPPSIRVLNSSPSSLQVLSLHDNKGSAGVVSGSSWDRLVLKSEVPVLVEFHASWCGPCRMVHRVIEEVATEYAGRLKCFVLHADNDLEVAESYDIKAVPVVLLFKNGKKHDLVVGTMPKEFYISAIESLLSSS